MIVHFSAHISKWDWYVSLEWYFIYLSFIASVHGVMHETSDFFYSMITFSYTKHFVQSYPVDLVFTLSSWKFQCRKLIWNPLWDQIFYRKTLQEVISCNCYCKAKTTWSPFCRPSSPMHVCDTDSMNIIFIISRSMLWLKAVTDNDKKYFDMYIMMPQKCHKRCIWFHRT